MSYRVLVVENDSLLRSDLQHNLAGWGYEVILADGVGEELLVNARLRARRDACDLVLLDIRLLDDDDEADESGLKLRWELAPLPAIIVTSRGNMKNMRQAFVDLDILDFFNRADGPRELKAALEKAVAKIKKARIVNSGKAWALLVGVDHYDDRHIGDLNVCAADVAAIQQSLSRGYEIVKLLSDATAERLPTRANILGELSAVAQAAAEDDLLLFYFSGHGVADAGESYLLPREARIAALKHTGVGMGNVREVMGESPARAKVIILDACHSGEDIGKAETVMTEGFIQRVFAEAEGMVVLASCKQGQVSYPWPEKGHSVFSYFLLQALAGEADFDKKGFVTVSDINRYVTDRVKQWAADNGAPQTPTLHYSVAGDIVLLQTRVTE